MQPDLPFSAEVGLRPTKLAMAAVARKRRGIVRASLMKLEDRIVKFEEKELEVSDRPLIQRFIGRLEAMEAKLKQTQPRKMKRNCIRNR